MLTLFLPLFLLGGGGCAALEPAGPPGPRKVLADWNDVDAAVEVAVKKAEVALDGPARREARRVVYRIRTVSDEPGELVVERSDGDVLTVSASIGRFGEGKEQEARLVGAVVRRLKQLRGVEHAAVR